jgi:putative peptide zinc metalloprotease protein
MRVEDVQAARQEEPASLDRPLVRLREGVDVWTLFPPRHNQRGTYIVGHRRLDRYVVIPEDKLSVVRQILPMLDGTHSCAEIDAFVLSEKHKQVKSEQLCAQLADAGLIEGSSIPEGDFTKASISAGGLNIAPFLTAVSRIPKFWTNLLGLICLALIASGIVLTCLSWRQVTSPLPAIWAGSRAYLSGSAFGLYIATFVITTLAHELAHGVAAAFFGLIANRIEVALYLGVIPMVYLRIPGLYTLSPKRRIITWSAGVFVNLTLASLGMIVLNLMRGGGAESQYLAVFILVNYSFVFTNLIPFLPTDGYFIFSTIFRLHNVRRRSTYQLMRSLAERKFFFSASGLFYLFATAALIALAVWRDLLFILRLSLHHKVASTVVVVVFLLPGSVQGIRRLKRR